MKWFSIFLALFLALSGARAEGLDDQYVRIHTLIQEADKLSSGGQPGGALHKYLEAQTTLKRFQRGYPNWNGKVVSFRLNYVADKIAALSARVPAPAAATKPVGTPNAGPAQPAQAKPARDGENQLKALPDQVSPLQADNAVLKAKLKEALSVQPATVDARELAKAEAKIKDLLKENDLLKVSLAQEKARPASAPDTKALDEMRRALAEANRKLVEQAKAATELAKAEAKIEDLLKENDLLKVSLAQEKAKPAPAPDTKALDEMRQALAEANRKLAEQTKAATELALEKTALQNKLNSLTSSPANAAEFVAGTNPLDPNRRPAVTALIMRSGGVSIYFPTVAGKIYAVEYSDTLAGWSVLSSGIEGTGGLVELIDPSAVGNSQRFYRLRVSH